MILVLVLKGYAWLIGRLERFGRVGLMVNRSWGSGIGMFGSWESIFGRGSLVEYLIIDLIFGWGGSCVCRLVHGLRVECISGWVQAIGICRRKWVPSWISEGIGMLVNLGMALIISKNVYIAHAIVSSVWAQSSCFLNVVCLEYIESMVSWLIELLSCRLQIVIASWIIRRWYTEIQSDGPKLLLMIAGSGWLIDRSVPADWIGCDIAREDVVNRLLDCSISGWWTFREVCCCLLRDALLAIIEVRVDYLVVLHAIARKL